jgi:hypothetical protein
MTTCFAINESQISHNAFDDEVIVVNLASGSYFSMHQCAAEIWRLLTRGPGSAASLAAAFPNAAADAPSAIESFLRQLVDQELIVAFDAEAQTVTAATHYSPPILETFDELRELLLADIIHDTDEAGWPHVVPRETELPRDAA